jgi:actin-related protein
MDCSFFCMSDFSAFLKTIFCCCYHEDSLNTYIIQEDEREGAPLTEVRSGNAAGYEEEIPSGSVFSPMVEYSSSITLKPTIVFDLGSTNIRAGFAGDEFPKTIFPSLVARSRATYGASETCTVGVNAERKHAYANVNYPIKEGHIENWDDLEKLFEYCFYTKLACNPQEHCILFSESIPSVSKSQREQLAQIMFETFQFPAISISLDAILSLYASGKTTGCVLKAGGGTTYACSVYEGYLVPHAAQYVSINGQQITQHMLQLISAEHHHRFDAYSQRQFLAQDMKEKLCYLVSDFTTEEAKKQYEEKAYKLPDGQLLTIGRECYQCPEGLFQPSLMNGLQTKNQGIHEAIYHSIATCDEDFHQDLYQNIVLSGATTKFPNIVSRLEKELKQLTNHSISFYAPNDRENCAWHGGSIYSSISTFHETCSFKKHEYEEHGPEGVHRKIFH